MTIHEMSREECLRVLTGCPRLTRLACASANQPYVVPVYLAYHDPFLYGFTTMGQKVDWMRANPLVCVEFDEVASDTQWVSVIVFGRYEELPAVAPNVGRFPEHHAAESEAIVYDDERSVETVLAHQLLAARAMWWEPASTARAASAHGDLPVSAPIYYKVWIDQVTGYESTTGDADERSHSARPIGRPGSLGWLDKALARLREEIEIRLNK